MNWDDIGFLLSKNKYNENSLIVEIFTEKHGKVSGIIFGGTSKKIKNYLQIGNKIFVNYNAKSREKLGYFKIEIYQALSPFYFDNHQKNKKPFEKKQNAKVVEKKTSKIEEKITPRKLSRPKKVERTKQKEKTIAPRRTGERASNDPRNKN